MCSAMRLPLKNKSLIAKRACCGFPANQIREYSPRVPHVTAPDNPVQWVLSDVTLGVMVAMGSFCRQVTYCFCKKERHTPSSSHVGELSLSCLLSHSCDR